MSNLSTPFAPSVKYPSRKFTEKEFIHYMEVESVADGFDPKKPSEFLIDKIVKEYERVPIDEYINSFASKVGLKNELKGIISKSQMDDFISSHKAGPGFVDLTKLPNSEFEMAQMASRLDSIWSEIPDELKVGLTKEEFIKTMSADKLKAYVLSKLPIKDVKKESDGE